MNHFKGKKALEHVIEARQKGRAASQETHGTELPGHYSAAADAAKETETPFGKQPPLITKGEESTLITQIGKAVPMPKDWEAPTATEAKPAAEAERDR